MTKIKLVSFVLPAYKAKFLKKAIDSILNQSYRNFELIIVDDASPENLKEIVDLYSDKRMSYYRNERNLGGENLVMQWNHCIQFAKGDYIILAADDDLYHQDYLLSCAELTEKYPEVDVIRSRVAIINENDHLTGIDGILPEYCNKNEFLYFWMSNTAFTCIGNFMFKANVLKEKKFIDFPSAFCSDAATAIMMAENGIANTAQMLFSFRISTIHLSSSKKHLKPKLDANNLFYKWLLKFKYAPVISSLDKFYYQQVSPSAIRNKCNYDYYNQVIKYLPLSKLGYVKDCELITGKQKVKMIFRYCFDHLVKKWVR